MPQGSTLLAVAVLLGVAIGLVLRRSQTRKSTVVIVAVALMVVAILFYGLRVR
jgi:uncharacterized membrane protein YadS